MRRFPTSRFRPVPDDLQEVLFCLPEKEMAEAMGVTVELLRMWRDGIANVPLIAYKLACVIAGRLPPSFGPFSGAHYQDGRLVMPGHVWKESIRFEEVADMPYMRQCVVLCQSQADLIERLTVERDFYKRQCRRESRFGMVLNRLFP